VKSLRTTRVAWTWLAVVAGCLALAPSGAMATGNDAVTGSGHITRGGENRTFEFSARRTAGGGAKGTANLQARYVDRHLEIEIDCLRVVGTTAYLSGVVVRAHPEDTVGAQARFAVVDNGEGSGSPDQISLVETYGPGSPVNCETDDDFPGGSFPVERGNVQVHR